MLFPDGITYSIEKRQYLTSKTNQLFELTRSFKGDCNEIKQKTHHLKSDESSLVAGTGLEPVTFGL